MSRLVVDSLKVRFGSYTALDDVSFEVAEQERLCLLGPSGCGKTTTLRVIAGFIIPDAGTVRLNGESLGTAAPERRNIGILFQSYALFPHMSVYDNVAFGLRMRRRPATDIRRRVADALALVRLSAAAQKRPAQLSGGEQQRVAFARAIVIEPRLLLLDEPFSNLDARLRHEMREELLELLGTLSVATVMVTHDQEEAMAIADRIIVMNHGNVEQVGTPAEIYERPASAFVARFVGESNLFRGTRRGGNAAPIDIEHLGRIAAPPGMAASGTVDVMIRPEKIRLRPGVPNGHDAAYECRPGVVDRVQYLGHRTQYTVSVGAAKLTAWCLNERPTLLRAGDAVSVEWPQDGIVVFPGTTAS